MIDILPLALKNGKDWDKSAAFYKFAINLVSNTPDYDENNKNIILQAILNPKTYKSKNGLKWIWCAFNYLKDGGKNTEYLFRKLREDKDRLVSPSFMKLLHVVYSSSDKELPIVLKEILSLINSSWELPEFISLMNK